MEPSPESLATGMPLHPGRLPNRAAANVLLSGVLFGTAGTARAMAAPAASNVSVGALRVMVGGLTLLAALPRLGGSRAHVLALWRRPVVWLMAGGAALYQVCFFAAVVSAGVAMGTLVTVASTPIFAGLIGWVALGHRPAVAWIASTALGVTGLVLLAAGALGGPGSAGGAEGAVGVGLVLALVAGLCSGVYNVGTKRVLDGRTQAIELTAATFALASVLLLPGLLTQPIGWLSSLAGVGLALYLGAVTAALANSLLASGVQRLGPGPASTLMLADPVTATVLGVVVLHEVLTGAAIAGIALVLAGLALQAAPRPLPRVGRFAS
jgi:DME family drug/metabolite transporter